MTVHRKMYDKKKGKEPTIHRIYVGWEGGYFVTSLNNPNFHNNLQEMVADLGPPVTVEFRDQDEDWYREPAVVAHNKGHEKGPL
jgi:hypothetical protein